jgi:hypothetical protein
VERRQLAGRRRPLLEGQDVAGPASALEARHPVHLRGAGERGSAAVILLLGFRFYVSPLQ